MDKTRESLNIKELIEKTDKCIAESKAVIKKALPCWCYSNSTYRMDCDFMCLKPCDDSLKERKCQRWLKKL